MRTPKTEITYGDGWTFSGQPGWAVNSIWDVLISRLFANGFDPLAHFFIHFIAPYPANSIAENFAWTDLAECVESNKGKHMYLVFDAHTEAPCFRNVEHAAVHANSQFGIGYERMILWGGSADTSGPIRVIQNLNAFTLVTDRSLLSEIKEPSHHFAMLARVPKPHRVATAVEVLKRGLDTYGYMSCGSAGLGDDPDLYRRTVPEPYKDRFPLLLDGLVPSHQQNDVLVLPQVTEAFCQLIPETSYEWLYPGWSTVFPTEKSEKCFLLGQVPIFVAPAGHVDNLRQLGFDLFDDIIDHSYDNELDPDARIPLAVDQLEQICRHVLDQLKQWRTANLHRLRHNRDLCDQLKIGFWEVAFDRFSSALVMDHLK